MLRRLPLYLSLLLLTQCRWSPPGRWKEHMDSVFQFIDRAPVSTGLLADYGFALVNYARPLARSRK